MKFCYKNGILDWRIVVLVFLLYLLHALTVKILVVASIIAICESGILLFLALKRRLDLYLYTLVIILATTFEFPDRKSTRLNSSHVRTSRMPSSA